MRPGFAGRGTRQRPIASIFLRQRVLLELLFSLVFDVLGQLLFEVLAEFGLETFKQAVGRTPQQRSPILAGVGHLLLGHLAGGLSLLLIPQSLVPPGPLPGLSLVLSPLITGSVMQTIGDLVAERRSERPVLFTFRAGALFAFGMALVRFAYLVLEVTPFN